MRERRAQLPVAGEAGVTVEEVLAVVHVHHAETTTRGARRDRGQRHDHVALTSERGMRDAIQVQELRGVRALVVERGQRIGTGVGQGQHSLESRAEY